MLQTKFLNESNYLDNPSASFPSPSMRNLPIQDSKRDVQGYFIMQQKTALPPAQTEEKSLFASHDLYGG